MVNGRGKEKMKNIPKSRQFLMTVATFLVMTCVMAEEKTPITRLNFETDVEGKNLKYEDGISGRGVLLSPDSQLKFPVKNNISLTKGTISIWIKPINWNGTSKEGYPIVSFSDSSDIGIGGLAKHHNVRSLGISLYLKGENPGWLGFGSDPKPLEKWTSNTWHNLVFTFSQEEFVIYLDAVRVGACTGETANELWQRLRHACSFRLGGAYKGTDFCSVIDEFTIYNVILNEEEISRAFKKMILAHLN